MWDAVVPASVPAALRLRAARTPGRAAYIFLSDGEDEQERVTYAGLDARAREVAAALGRSCRPGERALLLYPPGLDFVTAFFGCLYAGVIAVPAYPPRSPRMLPRLLAILADAQPAVALASGTSLRVRGWLERTVEGAAVSWLDTGELEPAPGWQPPEPDGDAVAFLQYTSGSTATPKGVMITQANLAHNQRVIQEACGHSEESVFVSWLPVYHDLGLIGNLLQSAWVGGSCVLMAPVAFLQNPTRWLRAISHYRGTTSGGPNFAYDLCARKVSTADIGRLDLSSWQVAFNGAEPVREETLARFSETFAPAGFRPGALYPCYGLAEATLMVSGGRPGEETVVREVGEQRLVGCGHVLSGIEVAIVDPGTGTPCPADTVGEIWVGGGSVAPGYWNRSEETAHAFGAVLPDGRGPWLRTGDLGVLAEGGLFIAGRLKDLIILRGRNHYPQDLESTAGKAHPTLGDGTCAAFAIDAGGEERLVIIHEVERHAERLDEIAAAVRQTIAEEHEALVYEVLLVPKGGVPRTTSGKVQRQACRDLYLQGALHVLGASRLSLTAAAENPWPEVSQGSLEWLRQAFAVASRVDPAQVDPDRPLTASGLDSLAAVELKHAVEKATGISLPVSDLLEGMTLLEAAQRIAGAAWSEAVQPGEDAGEATGEHPLSWNQRSLWFLHRLAPESPAYNIPVALRLEGNVEAQTISSALGALVDRHAALRTLYVPGSDGPVQRIEERAEMAFIHMDASGWAEEKLERALHENAFRPFDLERGPIFRAALFERGSEALLVLAAHHIAADFWSFAILVRELGMLCAAGGSLEAAGLPALPACYTDFVRWQEESLAGSHGEELESWWRKRLEGAPPLDLPADRPRSAASSGRGTTRTARLSAETLAGLRTFAGERGATLFMALLAGLQALLARHSGQEDFLVGSPTSGREASRWAGVVGYFVNPLALRADLAGDPTGEELIARIRRASLAAFARTDFPFARLPEFQPQAMLTLHQAAAPELAPLAAFALGEAGARLSLGVLTMESLALENPAVQRDLTLAVAETGGGLTLALQLDADLFDAATADRMLGHLGQVLDSFASDPHRRLSAIELLTGLERQQILAEWSGPGLRFPAGMPLHRLFEAQAARSPEAVAISCEGRCLTYGELDRRANRLARHLRCRGVGPETRVGLYAERSLSLVEGLLAILKAGGAYVPLDPRAPADRLGYFVADSGMQIVLSQEEMAASLPASVTVVGLNEAEGESADPCEDGAVAANAAYVLYTSGSTGRPKGVVVSHAGVARLLAATEPWFGFHAGDVWTLFHSFAFDFSVWEIWGALAYGGRLVVAPYEESRSPEAFYGLLDQERVTVLNQTPSAFRQLVAAEGRRAEPPDLALRWVVFGGEALEPASLLPWFDRRASGTGPRLANLYGITETTVHATFRPVLAADAVSSAPSLVGAPIPDLRIYLLARNAALVPTLVAGEIHIGGDGLARGYLGRPELTAERFVPDPWSGRPGARLYRSGDLARWRADGDLEYLGRIDDQVKIRGFRVEPGEVQAVLAFHPGVREAVVLGLDGAGERRLAGWVVLGEGAALSTAELRRFLRERLPDYMVPTDFIFLERLPLTANGKVDRRALPSPAARQPGQDAAYEPPRNPVEEMLAGIWADLLRVDPVGIQDDFFELGGHSLLAAQVASRLREPFGIELPVRLLFERPTVAALAEEIERLRGGAPAAPPVIQEPRQGEIPLSFAQESLWFLDRLAPGLPVYNLPAALRIRGDLDLRALASALEEIVRRHEVLRTVFAEAEGRPHQVVLSPVPFPLALIETEESEAWRLASAEAVRPFDLANGPLIRARLLRCSLREHLLVLTLHHAVADGWSRSIFLRELKTLYAAGVAGRPSPLPELPVQYADYAIWQQRWLAGEVLADQLAWWREQLAGAPPALDLPTDRPWRATRTFRGSSQPVLLPARLVSDLRGLARRHGATLFMALLAGFAVVLHRYSGQEDVTIGSPVANRPQPELERLIGFFVNSLPLRAKLEGDPSTAELLTRLRAVTLAAHEHRDLPFDRLVEELHPRRDLSRSPLFQVMLAVEDGVPETAALPDLGVELVPLHTGTAKFDLTLALSVTGGGLAGDLELSSDLFDAATAARMVGHLGQVLDSLASDPHRRLSALELLTEPERREILAEWSGPGLRFPSATPLHQLFEAQAERSPEAVAVSCEGRSLTYGQLDRRANRLARHLRRKGVGPEVRVGLCVERSLGLVEGLLAILKAGGAYVPLDPRLPAERIAQLIADSGMRAVLAQHDSAVPGSVGVVDLEDGEGESSEPLAGGALAANAAYVLYTSGSTGQPKGVVVSHAAVARLLAATEPWFGFHSGDVWTLFHSFAFDFSVWEIWGALAFGGRLVVVPYEVSRSSEVFYSLLDQEKVTVLNQTPSAFRQLIAAEGRRAEPLELALRWVIFGGEALEPASLRPWLERRPAGTGPRLANLYGITETTVHATFRPVAAADAASSAPSLVGVPVPDLRIYLLDRNAALVPALVAGEIHVGGGGLARGYLDRPDLTAERFVPDLWSGLPGERLYRSGDLARWRPDGELEYLRRTDDQVKIRGFRVEPGEIQVVLASHPEVREAVVLGLEGESERRLAGWVVPAEGATLSEVELRRFLREHLPDYMVPADLVFLESLPLTANGKVDRRALPAPNAEQPDRDGTYEPPRSPIEEVLTGIWADLLRKDRIGIHDDFFELGGHSLLAAQVVSRLREPFAVEVPVRLLFERPTVAALAEEVERLRGGAPVAPALRPAPRTGDLPLSFAQQRLWFLHQLETDSPAYNVPAVARLAGDLDAAALEHAFQRIADRHEVLRTTFRMVGDRPVQVVAPRISILLPRVDLSGLDEGRREEEALRLAQAEAVRRFDLQAGPLMYATLLRMARRVHVLLLTLHHIVSDGWSNGVLVRELAAFYAAALEGHALALPPLPVQYADFAVWQRSLMEGGVLESLLAFWRERLAGAPPVLELPADRPRPAAPIGGGGRRVTRIAREVSAALAAFGRRKGVTPFMTLLSAWSTLLFLHTEQEDLVVGTPIANRNRVEIEGLIGFFVNTLALRIRLSPRLTFRELVAVVREESLLAFAHQDLPFERLVEELAPDRSLAYTPLFQVLFALQDALPGGLLLPGLSLSLLELQGSTAKFDLSLFLTETEDGLIARLEHSADRFDGATADRILERFRGLLEAVASDPEQHLAELQLLPEAERQQVLAEWNDVPVWDGAPCVHRRFQAWVERTPEALAVHAWDGTALSYAEVNRLADGLARRLREVGVVAESAVGVCLERGWESVVALLAVLKAGGCYLPLDPTYPRERLDFMLADAGAPVIVTRDALVASLPHGATVLSLDPDGGWPEPESPAAAPLLETGPDHLAYLIYTSGSTGLPKGVALPHRTLANLIDWQIAASAMPVGRTAQLTSPSFDVSLQEVFSTWGAGGTLILVPEAARGDAEALLSWLRERGVERLFLPFVALQQLAETAACERGPLPPLGEIVTAGEQLQVTPEVRDLFSRLPRCVLRNQYGPSETHVATEASLWGEPLGEVADWPALPPIGRPIAATSVRLLDPRGRLVPVSVPGEVYLGGAGLARGYLGRPDLTAERFVPDPYSAQIGARLYRTGDLARLCPTGEIDFLGRVDHQVKIRGFRVELGEIEAALSTYPAVREAVVVARGNGAGRRLVAYLVTEKPLGAPRRDLRELLRAHLMQRLPDYMLPATFVPVDSFPRTPSGKLDRRTLALNDPDPEEEKDTDGRVPRTPVEEVLAGIWAEVLGLERVGIRDSFFDLGGHSLLATRVVSRLHSIFGVELPVRALFERPTVAELSAAVEEARRSGADVPAPPMVPMPREGDPPLSFAQERFWFLAQLGPGSPAYHLAAAMELHGDLRADALAAAFAELVARHESLRTTFARVEGRQVQRIAPFSGLLFPMVDLEALPVPCREAEVRRMAAEEARRPFCLEQGPLLRVCLLRTAAQEHALALTLHHIVSDGWSMDVLAREVSSAYAALARGERPALPELPVQYADYAIWQRRWLEGGELERQLDYWRQCLEGAPEVLELPTDRPRPPTQTFRGAQRTLRLAPALSAALTLLGRREGATLFMALLASSAVLLSRWACQPDIVLGIPIANREWTEIEGLIGLVANTLALRICFTGATGFGPFLSEVRQIALAAYAHQDLPFERLVDDLRIARSPGRSPLFQVLLGLWSAALSGLDLPGVSARPIELDSGTAKFDLTLRFEAGGQGIAVQAEYATDLFDAVTIERLLAHLQILLVGAVAAPECRLADLPLLGLGERHQVLFEWNDTALPVDSACLHELFEQRAMHSPEALAVEADGERLTWSQLSDRSSRLARDLRRQGVRLETRVGLCLPRSVDQIVAILGVLKAGGAYVPLDPASPQERLRTILEEACVSVVVTAESLRDRLPAGCATLLVSAAIDDLAESPDVLPQPTVGPANLAYILYTSGSTGSPKGVMIEHRSVVSLAAALVETVYREAGPSLRVALNAPLAFDASVKQWIQLLAGHSLHIVPDEIRPDAGRMLQFLRDRGVQVLDCTPGQLSYLLAAGLLRQPGSLERVLVGGEELSRADWSLLAGSERPCFYNVYGPTECTVDATVAELRSTGSKPVLGRPIANARIYLLDFDLHPVLPGSPGELCIGGAGVARGYLLRPAQTAESFVPDPWSNEPGERIYRTGDLARQSADGTLEFLGRRDHQVKVHGLRIELGEIEAVLGEHPDVSSAAVLVRSDELGESRLVAYVACSGERPPSANDLRSHLKQKLVGYMVPAAFAVLAELPRTRNGKIDRTALAALGVSVKEREGGTAPDTPLEKALSGMVAEVLGLEQVGLHDNFFELGGHSMRAAELVASLRDAFGIDLPLFHVFDAPTVAGLAGVLLDSPEWSKTVEELAPALLQLIEPPAGGSAQVKTR